MIEVSGVTKKYGKVHALDHVSFTVKNSGITCLLGINGVGKSTILKAIAGLLPIDDGIILIDGDRIKSYTYNNLAFVPDRNAFYPRMSIEDIFYMMKTFYIYWDGEKANYMLEYFKLHSKSRVSELSKGNLARLKLVVGFSQGAQYLLLDEPFLGIDIFSRQDFIKALKKDFTEPGQTILLTTHEIAEIEGLADRVILLDRGSVIQEFDVNEAINNGMSILDIMRQVYINEDKEH